MKLFKNIKIGVKKMKNEWAEKEEWWEESCKGVRVKRDRISKESFFAVSQQKVDEEIDIESMIFYFHWNFIQKYLHEMLFVKTN